jgi:hypothetical protein
MTTIQIASTIAVVTGLAGLVPQIWAMARTRSSSGQSPTGWTLGIGVNLLMGYVNFVAYDARGLAVGNVLGVLLCGIALTAVLRYRRTAVAERDRPLKLAPDLEIAADDAHEAEEAAHFPTAVRPAGSSDSIALSELPTGQFWTVKQEFEQEESRRRESGYAPAFAAAA